MPDAAWFAEQSEISFKRLLPRIEAVFDGAAQGDIFQARLRTHFPTIFRLLYQLYNTEYDFFYHLEQILLATAEMYLERPAMLKQLDQQREADPLWFQSQKMVGGVCYVDLFAGDLEGIRSRIPYFKELGLTYLHLMPLFKIPVDNNDGGYAISDYRSVHPDWGTMTQLKTLAQELCEQGISLVLDFVFNHTSDEHLWAQKALDGDKEYQDYYFMFPDRSLPDQYESHLREIFPQQAPGSFTFRSEINRWVWTTFNNFQWDLNYTNPAVFQAMLREMLFIANQGVEILRLDAVAFIWKQMGTSCENLPQAHTIIQAFNALLRVAAPALLFKSEAIVHPDAVASYIDWQECPISYNPTLMALLWETLATRDVKLLHHSMCKRFMIQPDCAWVNYVRCHDDIGWTFADEDAAELWINGFDHRQFLNAFYTGSFAGSFARGLPFNYNPVNRDMRISGTSASLAGLEQGLALGNTLYIENALARILLIHSVILSIGGIPLIYLGDEIATCNDYHYENDPTKSEDSRWAHRPYFDWERAARRTDISTVEGHVFQKLSQLIRIRKQTQALAGSAPTFFDTENPHVLGYLRDNQVLVLANFSEHRQIITPNTLRLLALETTIARDLIDGETINLEEQIVLESYRFLWIEYLPDSV